MSTPNAGHLSAKLPVPAQGANGGWIPSTDAEREAARRQVERILSSPVFSKSKHYCSVLKYVVDRTLEGRAAELKERTIGIDVFGKPPDYDTSVDHAVRSAAGEIRKRLAQYYRDPGRDVEIRLDLNVGSYIPHFGLPGKAPLGAATPERYDALQRSRGLAKRLTWVPSFVAGALLALGIVQLVSWRPEGPLDRFWAPVVAQSSPVLLCVGNDRRPRTDLTGDSGNNPAVSGTTSPARLDLQARQTVAVEDAITLARLAGALRARGKEFRILTEPSTTFNDLREYSAVLIGARNNDWVLRLVSSLRFRFDVRTSDNVAFIRDSQNPSRGVWPPDSSIPQGAYVKDYAIVTRCWDPKSGRIVVVAAGLRQYGTLAAGEFLTSSEQMAKLAAQAPRGWDKRNLQVVLSTDVVKDVAGPPNIVASHFW